MYRVICLACVVALASILAACGPPGAPAASAPPASSATPITANVAPATQIGTTRTPIARTPVQRTPTLQIAITTTPTIAETPTITPTPGPPTATATPAPGTATLQSAEDLDQALVSFAQAAASGDTQATLQAQRKLLDATQAAAKAAAADQSPYGQKLRSALGAIQGGAAGDYDKLNEAHQDLLQIAGSNGTPVVGQTGATAVDLPRPAAQSQQSLSDVAGSLQRSVDAYNKALNSGNASDLLRAQADLLNAVAAADTATKNSRTPLGQQIQTALGQIHDGLGGDTGKFADAETTLSGVTGSGSNSPNGSPTASSSQHADLQPLQNGLDSKLQTLQVETSDQNKDNLKRAQDDLNQAIQNASSAIANDHSPSADRFRDALNTAKSADTDFSKIQSARDQLKAALNQQ